MRVLVVEDEYLIASALEVLLQTAGRSVLGPVGHVSAALDLIAAEPHIDAALLDVKLGDEPVFPVADALLQRRVRFAFMSGYERGALPPAYQGATYFRKLVDPELLLRWVKGSGGGPV